MDVVRPGNRIRRKSSAARLTKGFELDASEPFDASVVDGSSIFSAKTGGVGSTLSSAPSLPQSSSVALGKLQELIQRRITTWIYIKQVHQGTRPWFQTVFLSRDDLNSAFEHNRMRARTTRFAVLGMSLSALLDISAPHDFLKGLLSLIQEFESVQDDRFDRTKSNRLSRATGKTKRNTGGADFSMGLQDSGDASFLYTPTIPFELDYFQVLYTTCDILVETFQKILNYLGPTSAAFPSLNVPEGFPQPPSAAGGDKLIGAGLSPGLMEVVQKVDARLKKMSVLLFKELDTTARDAIKKELSLLSGGVDWGLDGLNEMGL